MMDTYEVKELKGGRIRVTMWFDELPGDPESVEKLEKLVLSYMGQLQDELIFG